MQPHLDYSKRRRLFPSVSRQRMVERVQAYVRARLDSSIPLSELCRLVGCSERGLRNAFYGVHGIGPKRWMLAERLDGARRVLTGADAEVTVTRAATAHGFRELGRFAANYKQAFGETPSKTLRSSSRRTSASDTLRAKGPDHASASLCDES
jgi:transcriptional regulator GlxA family with amidase domain